MKVNIRFYCPELVGNAPSGEYELPDGSDVATLVRLVEEQNGGFVEDYFSHMIFTVDHRPATESTILSEGNRVNVMRKIFGG